MKDERILKISLILILLAVIIVSGYFSTMTEEENIEYEMKLEVANVTRVGISNDDFELNFGRVPLGGYVTKSVSIDNRGSLPSKISIEITGSISSFISLEKNNFFLDKSSELKIYANATEYGNFTGKMSIKIIKPKNFLARMVIV